MKTPSWIRGIGILAGATLAAALVGITPAGAVGRNAFSMEILVDGRPLREYPARGRVYVEALREREYAVRLSNHTGGRVAVALAVDGLNSIDARSTSAGEARKWILGPYETITLEGWQTGQSTARRFFFTTEPESYGAWLGRTDDLGVVSAAFFREKARPPVRMEQRPDDERKKQRDRPAVPAPEPSAEGRRSEASSGALSDEYAATGIGREIDHRVRQVRFEAEPSPAAVIDVRYEYREALVRLGVLPGPDDPLARREGARGFSDTGFAPDPFRRDD